MSYIKMDKEGNITTVSDGARLVQSSVDSMNPAAKSLADNNERVLMDSLDKNPQNAHSMLEILDSHRDSLNNGQRELVDLAHSRSEGFDGALAAESIDKLMEFNQKKTALREQLELALKTSPTGRLLDNAGALLENSPTILDKVARVLNFDVALESGFANGVINSLRGKGTVLEGIQDGLARNTGFADVLKNLGVPKGPEFQFRSPDVPPLAPSQIAYDMVENVLKGELPVEFRPFGPVMSTRGAVGLSLDILLAPSTYLSFGTNVPAKTAAKEGAASIARFAGRTLLTDVELTRGLNALKATDFGKAVLEGLDRFAAVKLGKTTIKDLGEGFMRSFFPDYGIHKETADIIERSDRFSKNLIDQAGKTIKSTFQDFTEAEKLQFANEMFERNRVESLYRRLKGRSASRIARADEAAKKAGFESAMDAYKAFKEGKEIPKELSKRFEKLKFDPTQPLGLQPFANPKFQRAAEHLIGQDGIITKLAKFGGLPEEILHKNYIPGIIEETGKESAKAARYARRKLQSTGALRKEFKIKPVDPEGAYLVRAAELATVGGTRHAIRRIVKKFGATYDEAMQKGFTEFFPRDVAKQFGVKFGDDVALKDGQKVFFPQEIMNTITEMAQRQNIPTNAFLKVMGGFTQQFKAYVTSVWPAFHARNAFSNQILRFQNEGWKAFNVGNNKLALQALIDSPKLDAQLVKVGEKQLPLRVIKKWAEADGIRGTNKFIADTGGKLMDNLTDREISAKLSTLFTADATKSDLVKIGREIGGFVEDHAKMTSYISALKDGFSRAEAKQIVDQSLFDYGHLTSFEKGIMQRLFPFYTFTRKNLGAQLNALMRNPGRQAAVIKFIKDMHDDALSNLSPQQLEAFNELKNSKVLQSSFAVPVGFSKDENGNDNVMWMTGFGLPQENVLDLFNAQGLYFQLNPLIKLAGNETMRQLDNAGVITFKENYTVNELRFLFNDVFKTTPDRERLAQWINNPNGFKAHALTRLLDMKVVKRDVIRNGKPTGEKEYSFTANPRILDVLRNTVMAKAMSSLRSFSDPNIEASQDFIKTLTGFTIYNQSVDRSIASQQNDLKRAIGEEYKKAGVGYTFQQTGVAKDSPTELKKFNKMLGKFK